MPTRQISEASAFDLAEFFTAEGDFMALITMLKSKSTMVVIALALKILNAFIVEK